MGSNKPDFNKSLAGAFFSDPADTQPEAVQDQHSPRIMGQDTPPMKTDADGQFMFDVAPAGSDQTPPETISAPADQIKAWKTADSNGKNRRIVIEVPEGYTIDGTLLENRTKRVQILTTPTTYKRMKAQADTLGVSFNEIVNRAFNEYLER